MNDIGERVPPQDIPAEAAVLGSMLVFPACVPAVCEILQEPDFFRPAHQQLFKIITWMHEHPAKWGIPDLITVRRAAQERGKLEALGGVEYLVSLAQSPPSPSNVTHYAQIVKDDARKRALIIAGQDAIDAGYGHGDADEISQAAARAINAVAGDNHRRHGSSAAEVEANIEAAISGQRVSVPWPWNCITRYAKACAPGAVSVLCGDPGAGKSFLVQEAMLSWNRAGIKTAMFHLEKNRAFHQARALGQLAGNHMLLSDEWQKGHPDDARAALAEYAGLLDAYGATVYDDPDGATTLNGVQAWLAARIGEGVRILGVDPITAANAGDKSWDADRHFVVACESMAARTGCSIILVTHPRGASGGKPGIDSLAGGRAYGRLTDCVMWIQNNHPPIESRISTSLGPDPNPVTHNRTLTLCKTRDGTGQGMSFALHFNHNNLTTEELGIIAAKKKRKWKGQDDE